MAFCITSVQDNVCFRGAIKSILCDANIDTNQKNTIIKIIEDRTYEPPNKKPFTAIWPTHSDPNQDFSTLFQNYLKVQILKNNIDVVQLKTELQMVNIEPNGFCLLFWEGNEKNENQHVTRYCAMQNDKVLLMDPSCGRICYFFFRELSAISPKGFSLVVFSFA